MYAICQFSMKCKSCSSSKMNNVAITSSGKKCKRCISNGKKCWQHCTSKTSSPKRPTKSKSHGCSNVGKYKNVPSELFCGPEGGSCPGTYPVNTPGRARAALSYARYAPNPEGIKKCARRVAQSKGWVDQRTGKLRVK